MSDPEHFLTRWSRRKLEPAQHSVNLPAPQKEQPADVQTGGAEHDNPAGAPPVRDQTQEPPFDPATLPPIESITAGSDIRDFLKPGVPLSLSRAALRRAWASDPAIRDFIEIAENQWDFTAPDSIPGFGSLDPADVPRLLAQIVGSGADHAETPAAPHIVEPETPRSALSERAVEKSEADAVGDAERAVTAQNLEPPTERTVVEQPSHRNNKNDATQNGQADKNLNYPTARHGHGRALPT